MSGTAYRITHKDSGLSYIGITEKAYQKRWRQHVSDARRYSTRLANAIKAYGEEAFSIEPLASARNRDDLNDLEVMLIIQHGTRSPRGFNMSYGGERSPAIEPETRAKISASRMGYKPTAEAIANQVAAMTGLKRPNSANVTLMRDFNVSRRGISLVGDHLEKIRASQRAIANARIGKPLSEETRRKISEAAKQRLPLSDETRSKLAAAMARRSRDSSGRMK